MAAGSRSPSVSCGWRPAAAQKTKEQQKPNGFFTVLVNKTVFITTACCAGLRKRKKNMDH